MYFEKDKKLPKKTKYKTKIYIKKALKQVTRAYKVMSIKILQIKINTISINVYLSKLTQKSITNIKLRIANVVIAKIMRHICNNLIFKKDRKSKLRKTFF